MTVITQQQYADPNDYVLSASFMKVGRLYYFDFMHYPDVAIGDYIIARTAYLGQQMGQVKAFVHRDDIRQSEVQTMLRPATPADLLLRQQWQERELSVLIDCREQASKSNKVKDIKFVSAEYNYDGSLMTILFTVDDKDTPLNGLPRLRSIMQKALDTRVEFRQIGPRDVAKVQEGFGACGIPRCCSTFLTDFSMVSINMAKAQGISLNPSEITGMCGRLRCCLIYEYEQYVEARKVLPKMRKRIGTPHGEGRVVAIHPLQDGVTVQVDDMRHFVSRDDIIPMSEWEALKKAAGSPCSKNETGGCDCGAKRPRGDAAELLDEMGVPSQTPDEPEEEKPKKPRRRRRGKKRKPNNNNNTKPRDEH